MSDEASPADPPPSGGSKLVFVVLALCLGNLGATGFAIVKIGAVAHAAAAPAGGHDGKDAPAPTAPMDPFVVNLNEQNSSRYLKTSFELELSSAGAVEEFTRSKKAIRDQLLRYLSSLTVADTLGEDGKEKIQKEMLARIDKELGGGRVRRLYYTDFVVQ